MPDHLDTPFSEDEVDALRGSKSQSVRRLIGTIDRLAEEYLEAVRPVISAASEESRHHFRNCPCAICKAIRGYRRGTPGASNSPIYEGHSPMCGDALAPEEGAHA